MSLDASINVYPFGRCHLFLSKLLYRWIGVDSNDRETHKIVAWLDIAESREGDVEATLPSFLEIPTIVLFEHPF